MSKKRFLIAGAGIGGLTLAWWLKKFGFHPEIIEIAPQLRKGGYMIDFWGLGYDVAEKMDLIRDLSEAHYNIPKLFYVDDNDEKQGYLNLKKLRKRLDYRHFNLLRGELEEILYDHVKNDVKIRYNLSIDNLSQSQGEVEVQLSNGSVETFDHVIGADGQHSNTRSLVIGPEDQFDRFLGYYVASYTMDNFLDKDRIFYVHSVPNKQVGIYSIRGGELATLFIWKSDRLEYPRKDDERKKDILKKAYQDMGWHTQKLLDEVDNSSDFYFDSVSQIELNRWYEGRVSLVGDAAQ